MKTNNIFVVRYLNKIINPTNTICKECVLAKYSINSFPNKKFTTIAKIEIVNIDLSGPTKTRGF